MNETKNWLSLLYSFKCLHFKNCHFFGEMKMKCLILDLLLGAEVVSVATLGLAAVGSTRVKTGIALAADHLVTVVFHGQNTERWLNGT